MTLLLLALGCTPNLPTFLETYNDDPTGGVVRVLLVNVCVDEMSAIVAPLI